MNHVTIHGNLGQDPELRFTSNDTPVCNLRVATNKRWTDKNGDQQSETTWHSIVIWGRQAEIADEYLRKGDQVLIEGELQNREYEDKEGITRYVTEIKCTPYGLHLVGGGGGGSKEDDDYEEEEQPRKRSSSRSNGRSSSKSRSGGRSRRSRSDDEAGDDEAEDNGGRTSGRSRGRTKARRGQKPDFAE